MNAERLLAHYEQIADAPDAIARLRRFILNLAVRGKLVPQDPADEPALELLKRIAKEKARLVKARGIRTPKASEPIRDDELPILVPQSWAWARLCDIGKLSGGMTPSMNRSDFWDGDIVWLSPKDIKSDEVADSELRISAIGLAETGLELYRPGCLFMVARSGILKRTFPVSINRVPAAANQDMKVLAPFLDGQERYLQIMFRGLMDFLLRELVKTGTTVQSLKYAEFEQQPFPLPPLAEQRRIIAKVDELMGLCDRLEAARAGREAVRDRLAASSFARLNTPDPETFQADARFALDALPALTTRPDQIKQLRQAILNLAVRGKLVPQDANEISGTLPASACDEPSTEIPTTWRYVRLADLLAEDTRNGYSRKPDDAPSGTPILRISAGTIRRDGVVAEEEHKLISGIDPEVRLQYGLKSGDLLACRFNGNRAFVGRLTIFNDYLGTQPIFPDKLIRVRVASQFAASAFLRLAGDSDIVRNEIEAVCATTVGNWGISASNLKGSSKNNSPS
jgi:type I restriction enzyme, S subunit